jgi:hypothetical protein
MNRRGPNRDSDDLGEWITREAILLPGRALTKEDGTPLTKEEREQLVAKAQEFDRESRKLGAGGMAKMRIRYKIVTKEEKARLAALEETKDDEDAER